MKPDRFLSIAVFYFAVSSSAQNVVVPSGSSNADGNTYSFRGPAVDQPFTIRYQQIYAASEFTFLASQGGGWLTALHFRGDATNGRSLGVKMPGVKLSFSTTQRAPVELSSVFSDNVGTNDTEVFSGSLVTSLVGGHGQGPEAFTFEVFSSSKLFFYNPAAGNLMLDFRVFQGNTNTSGMIPIVFDAVNDTNDSVARVWGGDVNASTGLVDTIGLPTELFFWPNPKLTVQLQTNSILLSWPVPFFLPAPLETVLETSQSLSSKVKWQAVTNGIGMSNFVNMFTFPFDSAGPAAYFRLISTASP